MLVLWSGGLDSTLILADLAKKNYHLRMAEPEKAKDLELVRSISVNHPQVTASRIQCRRRKALLKEFKKRGWEIDHSEVTLTHQGKWEAGHGKFSTQPLLWIGLVFPYIWNTERLILGYLQTEWMGVDELIRTFNDMKVVEGKDTTLEFPLQYEIKPDVIRRIKEHKLLDLCTWCEAPKRGKACGNCNPCRTYLMSEWYLTKWPGKGLIRGLNSSFKS